MRTTIIGATFLIAGAGAAAVGALDNVALQGSDTLEFITKDVLAQCPNATAAGITYRGGGSTTGGNAMVAGTQTVSPQSRPLSTSEGCNKNGGETSEGLVIALDGLSLFAFDGTAAACGNGLAYTSNKSFEVKDAMGNPVVDCPGCVAGTNTYRVADWKDVIALVYAGKAHNNTRDCNGAVRRSLVDTFGNLFEMPCSGTSCTQLKRAWRRADLSGTTDTFLSLVGLSSMPLAKSVPGSSARLIDFCNANGLVAFGGDSDYLDNDPIRRPCEANEEVCARTKDLGLVTVVEIPANLTTAENYPTTLCGFGQFRLVRPAAFGGPPLCPNGLGKIFNKCFQPVIVTGPGPNDFTADCLARTFPVQGLFANGMDGRAYNLVSKKANGEYRTDNLGRFITGAFYRIHTTKTIRSGAQTCQKGSATDQIGCLSQANPCSIGFAGREGASVAPNIKALAVNNLEPTNANVEALVLTPGTAADDYPLSRKLYFNSLIGFENVTGGELELSKCMSNSAIVGPIANARGFLASPTGVFCEDFKSGTCAASASNACLNNPAGVAQ